MFKYQRDTVILKFSDLILYLCAVSYIKIAQDMNVGNTVFSQLLLSLTTSSGNVLTDIEGIFMQGGSLAVTSSLS